MAWVAVDGTDVYYVEQGAGPPIVFLHGMSSCAEAWWQQFDHLSDTFRCVAYDSVNHGHSSNSPVDEPEPDRADELEGFLDALGIRRPILAGNSMGALTILRWASRHPDDAAALVPSGMGILEAGAARRPVEPLDPEILFLPTGDSLTDDFKRERPMMFERYLRIRSTATRIEALRRPRRFTMASPGREELADAVTKIASPMQIVCGSLDRLLPACERLHGLVPGSRFAVIDGAPHNVYYEAAGAYNDIIDAFVSGVI